MRLRASCAWRSPGGWLPPYGRTGVGAGLPRRGAAGVPLDGCVSLFLVVGPNHIGDLLDRLPFLPFRGLLPFSRHGEPLARFIRAKHTGTAASDLAGEGKDDGSALRGRGLDGFKL